ncbi:hypothetical protein ARMSODRAFT_1027688 [Armillaria solidipes]|uniref:DUF6534 domain-containing protein n=1 Tax=Armillaria solidipes TaxID=1076256 RepID=A0A2H3AJQ8_9AGAR|nr:hypothetical protein ARMSODRAFT_1027688 [Armillaria solidipes]
MSSQSSIALPSVGETFGACYIGSVIATILYGISNLQVVIYYKRYPNDWWVYRYSRYFGWFIHIYPSAQFTARYIGRVLDTFHIAFTTHALYFYLISMFGNFLGALESDLWSMKLQLSLSNFIVVYVQWYESYSDSEALNQALDAYHQDICHPTMETFLDDIFTKRSLGSVRSTDGSYEICTTPNLLSVSIIKKTIYIFFSTMATADLIIATMMCYYLRKSMKDTMFSTTAALLLRLMRLVVVSGLATSAFSLLTLISYIIWPESLIFLGIFIMLSKLYVNSLLAMLNSRSKHHSNNRVTVGGEISLPAILRIPPHNSEGNAVEMNIGLPLQHVSSFHNSDQLDRPKGNLDCQV